MFFLQGVYCDIFDGFWYVSALSIGPIHDNSLDCAPNAKFRADLFELKHLKSLSFFHCFVSNHHHPIPIPTGNWEALADSLESLEFRSNPGLIGQIPTSFGNLKRLQSLVLLQNGLTGELQTNIGSLTKLRRLVLSGNRFTGQIPITFGGLAELLILDLSKNSLSGPLPLTFGGLTSLLKLDLSNNRLEGQIPWEIGRLKNLTLLDLSKNQFSGGLTKSLEEMCSLEELVLSNNPIGGDLMKLGWQKLERLIVLDLSNLALGGGIPGSITELKKLRFLGLSDNNLTGYISQKLADLPSISAIYLNGNNLAGELKFPEWFYGKLGRRFGAWSNPSLCYQDGLVSQSLAPIGVRLCEQEVTSHDPDNLIAISNLGNGNAKQNSQFTASVGFSRYAVDGFWCLFLLEALMALVTL